jgi:hypothetical protein
MMYLSTTVMVIILLIILFAGLEIILRVKGRKPVLKSIEKSIIKPEGKFYKEDPVVGFRHQQGEFELNISNRFQFTARHDADGHRLTSYDIDDKTQNHPEKQIWMFGCSYTYGWLIRDDETYPWLLQEKLSDYKIHNFAVSGYGTLQPYLQYRQAISEKKSPSIVILGYSDFHDKRNTIERRWKKEHSYVERTGSFRVPIARLNNQDELLLDYDNMKYRAFPFSRHSALMNLIENHFDIHHDKKLKSSETTKKILLRFKKLCDKHETVFIVAGIQKNNRTKEMLKFCESSGIYTVDISVEKGSKAPENSHYPYDNHPSPLAHKLYAAKLYSYLYNHKIINLNQKRRVSI